MFVLYVTRPLAMMLLSPLGTINTVMLQLPRHDYAMRNIAK